MGNKVTRSDFEWTESPEPHNLRRKEILKKYPQIKQLFGVDPWFKWQVIGLVLFQFFMMFVMKDRAWPVIIVAGYCFGGVINHTLMLAIHEIAHNHGFGLQHPLANKLLGIFANLPIGIPFSVSFKGYHLEHHRFQGDDVLDTDIPSAVEARLFDTTLGKFVWVVLQPFFYALRPLFVNPKAPMKLEVANTIIQLSFNAFVVYYFGSKVLVYNVVGVLLAMGCHPVAGHFISEHYMFKEGFETYSYYGPLNYITFNVGYHNEHHDFPYVPHSKLPEVRKIAPEYYNTLPHHDSWTKVIYDFIMDPSIGPYARMRRKTVFSNNIDKNTTTAPPQPSTAAAVQKPKIATKDD